DTWRSSILRISVCTACSLIHLGKDVDVEAGAACGKRSDSNCGWGGRPLDAVPVGTPGGRPSQRAAGPRRAPVDSRVDFAGGAVIGWTHTWQGLGWTAVAARPVSR